MNLKRSPRTREVHPTSSNERINLSKHCLDLQHARHPTSNYLYERRASSGSPTPLEVRSRVSDSQQLCIDHDATASCRYPCTSTEPLRIKAWSQTPDSFPHTIPTLANWVNFRSYSALSSIRTLVSTSRVRRLLAPRRSPRLRLTTAAYVPTLKATRTWFTCPIILPTCAK